MEMLVTKFTKGKYRNEGDLFAESISNENVKLMGEMIAWAVAILAVVLVAILSVTLVACGTTDSSETSSGEITAEQAPVNDFTTEIQNTEFVKLAMSAAVTSSTTNSISKTLRHGRNQPEERPVQCVAQNVQTFGNSG